MNKMKLTRCVCLVVISLIAVSLNIPTVEVSSNDVIIAGDRLPDHATLYYDDNGNVIGAKVEDPNAPEVLYPVNPFNAEDHLPEVKYRRNGLGIDVDFIEGGVTISTMHVDHDDLVSRFGSAEGVESILQQLDDAESRTESSYSDRTGPIAIPCVAPGPINPGGWVLVRRTPVGLVWTNVAEIYSATGLENRLTLKMSAGARVVSSLNAGPLAYGSEILIEKTCGTDYYVRDGSSRTIKYKFRYEYQYWVYYIRGRPSNIKKDFWYVTDFMGYSGEPCSPYPNIYRIKYPENDFLTLRAGQERTGLYKKYSMKYFGYEYGASLEGAWGAFSGSVPIFSCSDLTGHYSSTEALYKFKNPTNSYRVWRVYEWASNIGSAKGWVVSFFPGEGGGGGGCPILSVYDGEDYEHEGLLDIHNPEGLDVTAERILSTRPERVGGRYLLRLTEHPQTISHIDQVKLLVRLADGSTVQLSLLSAMHSTEGQVKWELQRSDDNRVDVLGAEHNNGISEYINLEFVAPRGLDIIDYIFIIEGNNVIPKY